MPILPLRRNLVRARHVTASSEQAGDRDVLVDLFPVETRAAELDLRALRRRGMKQPRKPGERNAERAAIIEIDRCASFRLPRSGVA